MKQNEPAVHFTFSLILIMELSLKKGCSAFSLLMGSTDEAYRKVKKKKKKSRMLFSFVVKISIIHYCSSTYKDSCLNKYLLFLSLGKLVIHQFVINGWYAILSI